ncbi:MAG: energy-coupling factor transporter transmembrane component T [Planctomycetota bacterium]
MSFQAWSYRDRGGPYAALDERARILLATCGVIACLATWDARVLAVTLAVGTAIGVASRVRLAEIRRFLLFAAFVVALLVLLTTWTREGTPEERWAHALRQALRMLSLVAFTAILPFTIDPGRYGLALRRMGVPNGVAFAVELSFRFVPTLAERFERTMQAQMARGLEVSAKRLGPVARLRRLVPLVVPVLMDSVLAGEDVADALELRAFGARRRTWSGETRWRGAEWAALGLGLALIALAVAFR